MNRFIIFCCTFFSYSIFAQILAQPEFFGHQPDGAKYDVEKTKQLGGVYFNKLAHPAEGIQFDSVNLNYIPENGDGKRLAITIKSNNKLHKYYMDIEDWKLVPIANYIQNNGEYIVTVSKNSEIKYDKSVENTLLGIRMLQADIVLDKKRKFIWDLYKKDKTSDKLKLAPNEIAEGLVPDFNKKREFNRLLSGFDYTKFSVIQLNIEQENIQFDVVDSKLILAGEPNYYFLKIEPDWDTYSCGICEYVNSGKFNETNSNFYKKITESNNYRKLKKMCFTNTNNYSWKSKEIYDLANELKYDEFGIIYNYQSYFSDIRIELDKISRNNYVELKNNEKIKKLKQLSISIPNQANYKLIQENISDLDQIDEYFKYNYDEYLKNITQYQEFIKSTNYYCDLIQDSSYLNLSKAIILANEQNDGKKVNELITSFETQRMDKYKILFDLKQLKPYKKNELIQNLSKIELVESASLLSDLAESKTTSEQVIIIPEPTYVAKAYMSKIYDYIPGIIDVSIDAARFSAFFRYVKHNYPNEWNDFVSQISHIKPIEDVGVITPSNLLR